MAPTTSTGPPFGESLADAECRDSGQQNNDQRMGGDEAGGSEHQSRRQ
jgi:hypothetical protein